MITKPGKQVVADLFIPDLATLEAISVDHLLFLGGGGGKKEKFLIFY